MAAAFVSLLFATGLVAFSSWPAASSGPDVPSVSLPPAPLAGGARTGALGRASAAVTAGQAIVLPAAVRRGTARTIARTGGRGGSTPAPVAPSPPAAAPAPSGGAPVTGGGPAPSSTTRQVTDGLADTTSAATHQAGSTVGGPAGGTIQTTGDQVAQTVRDVGDAAAPLLGALGG
jgi:hypothetical protein